MPGRSSTSSIRRSRPLQALLAGAVVAVVMFAALPAAAETTASDLVIVREGDVIGEDLYAAGQRVIVRGVIEGDLIAAAFNDVTIEGVVEGDVLAIAGDVRVSGRVEGSVRALGGTVEISGTVTDDVAAAGANVRVSGSVGRDVLGFGLRLVASGEVGRELRAQMLDDIVIDGSVGGDAEVNARTVLLNGSVGSDFRYRGEARIADGATVGGLAAEAGRLPVPIRVRALLAGSVIVTLMSLLALALTAWWLAPGLVDEALEVPVLKSLAVGFGALAVPPFLAAMIVVGFGSVSADLVIPAVLIVAPFALAHGALMTVAAVVGVVPGLLLVGRPATRLRPGARFALAAFVLVVAALIVPFGWVAAVAAWVAGTGSVMLTVGRMRRLAVTAACTAVAGAEAGSTGDPNANEP